MKYYLHYTGSQLYPASVFIAEAKRIGVNRCLPSMNVIHLAWGDKILLGTYQAPEISAEIRQQVKDGRKLGRKGGVAHVFGYFIVSGINLSASEGFKADLMKQLDIVETKDIGAKVQRQCGSYCIGTSSIVKNTVADIVSKIEGLEIVRKEKCKIFVGGEFRELAMTLSPVSFCRRVVIVDIAELPKEDSKQVVSFLYDYNKRAYIKKYATRGRPRKIKETGTDERPQS